MPSQTKDPWASFKVKPQFPLPSDGELIPGPGGNMFPQMSENVPASGPVDSTQPQGNDLQSIIAALAPLFQQQHGGGDLMSALSTLFPHDTVAERNKSWTATGPGGGFDQAKAAGFFGPSLSPEAALASQGPSAVNQWAQRGGVQGIDPAALAGFMAQREQSTGMGTPHMAPAPTAPAPHVGSWVPDIFGGNSLVGPKNGTGGGGNTLGYIPPSGSENVPGYGTTIFDERNVGIPPKKKKPIPFGGFMR